METRNGNQKDGMALVGHRMRRTQPSYKSRMSKAVLQKSKSEKPSQTMKVLVTILAAAVVIVATSAWPSAQERQFVDKRDVPAVSQMRIGRTPGFLSRAAGQKR